MQNREMINSIKKLRETIYQTEKDNIPASLEIITYYDRVSAESLANNNLSIAINENIKRIKL